MAETIDLSQAKFFPGSLKTRLEPEEDGTWLVCQEGRPQAFFPEDATGDTPEVRQSLLNECDGLCFRAGCNHGGFKCLNAIRRALNDGKDPLEGIERTI